MTLVEKSQNAQQPLKDDLKNIEGQREERNLLENKLYLRIQGNTQLPGL
jgi:hypothetical protein